MSNDNGNPQLENGYTKIANEIMESLAKIRIPGEAMQILLFILRKTYGWGKKDDRISLSQFVEGTGLKKPTLCKAINKLKKLNLIITQKGNLTYTTYCINKRYKTWIPLPKKVTLPKKVKGITQKGNKSLPKKVHTKETNTKETNTKETIYIVIFDFWNSKNIIVHRKLDDKMRHKISGALSSRTQKEIINAISNYATVLKSNAYYWTHEWTLVDFFSRGIDKFVDEAHPLTNFLEKKINPTKQNLIL